MRRSVATRASWTDRSVGNFATLTENHFVSRTILLAKAFIEDATAENIYLCISCFLLGPGSNNLQTVDRGGTNFLENLLGPL